MNVDNPYNNPQSPQLQNESVQREPVVKGKTASAALIAEGTIDDVFGLWKNREINLDEIREQQWVRKTK